MEMSTFLLKKSKRPGENLKNGHRTDKSKPQNISCFCNLPRNDNVEGE